MVEVTIGVFELSTIIITTGSLFLYQSLIKPAVNVAKMTYENGYSIKNFSALL